MFHRFSSFNTNEGLQLFVITQFHWESVFSLFVDAGAWLSRRIGKEVSHSWVTILVGREWLGPGVKGRVIPHKSGQSEQMTLGGKQEFLLLLVDHVIFVEEKVEIFARLREKERFHAIFQRFVVNWKRKQIPRGYKRCNFIVTVPMLFFCWYMSLHPQNSHTRLKKNQRRTDGHDFL